MVEASVDIEKVRDAINTLTTSRALTWLPAAFADLDARGLATVDDRVPDDDIVSRSLPLPDRELVRTNEMAVRIYNAADSRAPRR